MQHWPSFGNHIAWQCRINSFLGLLDCVAIGFIFCGAWDHCKYQITSIKFPESQRVNVKLTFHWSGGSFWTCTSSFRLWRGAEQRIWMMRNQEQGMPSWQKCKNRDLGAQKNYFNFSEDLDWRVQSPYYNCFSVSILQSYLGARAPWSAKNTWTLSVTKVCYNGALGGEG